MKIIFISILIIFIIINLNLNLNLNIDKYIEHFRLDFKLKELPTKDKKINLHFYTNKNSLKAAYLKLVGEYFNYDKDKNIKNGLIKHKYNTHPGEFISTKHTIDFNRLYKMINNNILKETRINNTIYLWDDAYNTYKGSQRGSLATKSIVFYKFIDIIKIIRKNKSKSGSGYKYTFRDNHIHFKNIDSSNIGNFPNLLNVHLFLDKYKNETLLKGGKKIPISTLPDKFYIDNDKNPVQFDIFYNELNKMYTAKKKQPKYIKSIQNIENISKSLGLSMYGHMINNSNSTGIRNITFTQICDNSHSHTSNCKKNSDINKPSNTINIYC